MSAYTAKTQHGYIHKNPSYVHLLCFYVKSTTEPFCPNKDKTQMYEVSPYIWPGHNCLESSGISQPGPHNLLGTRDKNDQSWSSMELELNKM